MSSPEGIIISDEIIHADNDLTEEIKETIITKLIAIVKDIIAS